MKTNRYSEEDIKRELKLEEEGVQLGIEKYRKIKREANNITELPSGLVLMHKAIEPLVIAIDEYKKPKRGGARVAQTRKFLLQFDTFEASYIIARTLMNSVTQVNNLQTPAIQVTQNLIDHLEYLKFKAKKKHYLKAIEEDLNSRTHHERHRKRVIMRAKRKMGIEDEQYSKTDKLNIGIRLVELFIETTGLIEKVREEGNKGWLLRGSQEALDWLENQDATLELLNPTYLPMIVEPKDWDSPFGGGFLSNTQTYRLQLVKTRNKDAINALIDHDMPEVYDAVNTLQKTAWRVNKKLYKILKEAAKLSSGLGGLPTPDEEPLPPKVWDSQEEFENLKETQPEVIKKWKREAQIVHQRRLTNRGKRINLLFQLDTAKRFLNEPKIYFVWTLDWRGRMYPVQSYLNPQNNDVGKALLEFAEGKPLGDEGGYWLEVHLANKFGVDKVSFDERVEWVRENKAYILDSARNPIDGKRFWCEADDPYQFLAACIEYEGYEKEGKDYISHLPIAMDGTCNGLQNFSAMLLDKVGGKATNLVPSEKPQDIYQEVVNVVNLKLAKEAMNEKADEEDKKMAQIWLGKVDRKLAKRNVMTVPYGVSLYGMKEQLLEEVEARDAEIGGTGSYLEVEDNFSPCFYLAKKMQEAIAEVVIASKEAMDYLQSIAKIAAVEEKPLHWTTPAGFLVYQNYLKQKSATIRTYWGKARVRIRLGLKLDTDELDKRKQVSGISPNFVHSMDASHLMKTVNTARTQGIKDFAMIHDSYGTHACDTGQLNAILREEFVKQYSQDVLCQFTKEIKKQIPEEKHTELPQLPQKGNLDISKVLDSEYFFA